jgi:hypothetical protein
LGQQRHQQRELIVETYAYYLLRKEQNREWILNFISFLFFVFHYGILKKEMYVRGQIKPTVLYKKQTSLVVLQGTVWFKRHFNLLICFTLYVTRKINFFIAHLKRAECWPTGQFTELWSSQQREDDIQKHQLRENCLTRYSSQHGGNWGS